MGTAVKQPACTNLKLRQLNRMVTRHYDPYIASAGIRNTQYQLLMHLAILSPIRPSDLAQCMHLEASTLTRNLQPLVAQGWVEIGPGEDARSRLVELTAAGRAKRAEGTRAWKRAQLALNERLGPERIAALHVLVDECIKCLDCGSGEIDGE